MMTDPRRYLIRMLVFLLVVAVIAGLLHAPLWRAFMGNPALNGVIVGALFLGIAYAFRQILRLVPERRWLTAIQKTGKLDNRQVKPVLLATVNAMLADQRQEAQLSALSLRSVLDGVAARLDEGREISRYMIGLLVFLGLLGTFWGLLQTIGAVGFVVGSLDTAGTDFDAMMTQLKGGLDAPLSGMATAFSSSLFGLAGSLILGFLDLQLGQAMGRFFNELEDWLSAFARFNDSGPAGNPGTDGACRRDERGGRPRADPSRQFHRRRRGQPPARSRPADKHQHDACRPQRGDHRRPPPSRAAGAAERGHQAAVGRSAR